MEILLQHHKLVEHLIAVKKYLLLTQGDFVLQLIETLR